MNTPPELRALVVEADPGLQELFETILTGWSLHFIRDPWAMPGSIPADLDLLVVDEDYQRTRAGKTPEWLESLAHRLPTIVLRPPAAPLRMNPSVLVLPKPFPVCLFLAFTDIVRQGKADTAWPPRFGP